MPSFVVFDLVSESVQGLYQVSDPLELEAAVTAHTLPTQGSLVVPDGSILNTANLTVKDGAVVTVVPAVPAITLATAQATQSTLIKKEYATQISNGFPSSALGVSHLYPSTAEDQFNLTACIVASMIPAQAADWTTVFWCGDSATPPVWNYLPHTAAQIHQVGIDSMAYIMAAKMRQATRLGQIQAATTVDAVTAILW